MWGFLGFLQNDDAAIHPVLRENAEINIADARTAKTTMVQNTTSPFIVPPH
ncbi:MAG TPA: hypothetical protein VKR43_09995 [Bryobacteraceae bacterium]|nr:hypothetical protein [Bryobacteraceae bacterium]